MGYLGRVASGCIFLGRRARFLAQRSPKVPFHQPRQLIRHAEEAQNMSDPYAVPPGLRPSEGGCACCPGEGCCNCCYKQETWIFSAAGGCALWCVALILFIARGGVRDERPSSAPDAGARRGCPAAPAEA